MLQLCQRWPLISWHTVCFKPFKPFVESNQLVVLQNKQSRKMLKSPKTILSLLVTGLSTLTLLSQQAQAVPMTGSIAFSGNGTINSTPATTTLNFGSSPESTLFGTGSYSPVTPGIAVNFSPIALQTGTTNLIGSGNSLWSFTAAGITYGFDLTNVTYANMWSGLGNYEILSGGGRAHATGFDDTLGTFVLTGGGRGNSFTFSFLSNANGQAVPDGGSTAALLGLAFVGVDVFRRKLQSILK